MIKPHRISGFEESGPRQSFSPVARPVDLTPAKSRHYSFLRCREFRGVARFDLHLRILQIWIVHCYVSDCAAASWTHRSSTAQKHLRDKLKLSYFPMGTTFSTCWRAPVFDDDKISDSSDALSAPSSQRHQPGKKSMRSLVGVRRVVGGCDDSEKMRCAPSAASG